MYKGASRALQHAHGVDRPHPSRGYIDGPSDEQDILPLPEAMTTEALRSELRQLRIEVGRIEQDIAVSKVAGNSNATRHLGQRKVTITARLQRVKTALSVLDGPSELQRLTKAVREIAGDEMTTRIFARARQLRNEFAEPAETETESTK